MQEMVQLTVNMGLSMSINVIKVNSSPPAGLEPHLSRESSFCEVDS